MKVTLHCVGKSQDWEAIQKSFQSRRHPGLVVWLQVWYGGWEPNKCYWLSQHLAAQVLLQSQCFFCLRIFVFSSETTRQTPCPVTLTLLNGKRDSLNMPSKMWALLSNPKPRKSYIFSQPPDGKPEGIEIFGLAERSYDDEINFVVRHLYPPMSANLF